MTVEQRLAELGLFLPAPIRLPPGVDLSFPWARRHGDLVFLSGHGPLRPDGSLAEPLGKVGAQVSPEQGYEAAKLTALAMLASLKREVGDLGKVASWLRVFGMVNTAPGFTTYPPVIDGFTHLITELYGAERGSHARSAIGVAGLPFDLPVEIEAVVSVTR